MSNSLNLVPFGQLADGSHGLALDQTTNQTTAAVIEVKDALPALGASENFDGRTVYLTTDNILYTFSSSPSNVWEPLKETLVDIGAPTPTDASDNGSLYYSTDTSILYLRVGNVWVGIAGALGSGVIRQKYTADGVSSQYPTGSTQTPPESYVEVFIDGLALMPGISNDFYMIGNDVKLNTTPSNGSIIQIRTLIYLSVTRNSGFFSNRYVSNGSTNSFETGAQLLTAGQVLVALDGVIQVPDTGGGAGTYDYKIAAQDNSIASLTSSGTTVTVNTTVPHGYTSGDTVVISGANQSEYNGSFSITVVDTDTFTYTAASAPSASPATGSTTYAPLQQNDTIVFYNTSGNSEAPANGVQVHIQTVENIIS